MNESDIQAFWQDNPCGDFLVGGLEKYKKDFETFFSDYDNFRYRTHSHLLRCLDAINFQDRETLEIGLGQGADAEQIIRRGANWSGVDLTSESVQRVKARLKLKNLPYREVKQGSVLTLPFPDSTFDLVFSHGVLHHVPDIQKTQQEIHRVLKPTGELIVMLYAKRSLNYLFSIAAARRLGLLALYFAKIDPGGIQHQHLLNAKEVGIWDYLKLKNFIHRNTDGPMNPYSKVYDKATVEQDFPLFKIVKMYKEFMHAPPFPVSQLPLQRIMGWHLWVHLKKVSP